MYHSMESEMVDFRGALVAPGVLDVLAIIRKHLRDRLLATSLLVRYTKTSSRNPTLHFPAYFSLIFTSIILDSLQSSDPNFGDHNC